MTREAWLARFVLVTAVLVAACAPALAPGTRDCVGFPPDVCQSRLAEVERDGAAHGGVVAYRIECMSDRCTATQGEGKETVLFGDGTMRQGGFGFAVPAQAPPEEDRGPLPVVPACIGVPAEWCRELARNGAQEVVDWSAIATVTVRCTGSCAPTDGDGETRVRLVGGQEHVMDWSYHGEAPAATR